MASHSFPTLLRSPTTAFADDHMKLNLKSGGVSQKWRWHVIIVTWKVAPMVA